ncbi:MAG: outer membrane lipoprotein carrier protein LolA [Alphaproteobacteria bacterium]
MVVFCHLPEHLQTVRRSLDRLRRGLQTAIALTVLSTLAGVSAAPITEVLAVMPTPGSVAAEQVAEIEDYLSDLRSLRADFVQLEPSGGTSSGDLYYQRPDKMRLDYDAPNPVLIVANGWQVIYHDRKLDQVSHLLTSQTPLAFLLQKKVKLSGDVTVTDVKEQNGEILLTLVQTDEPELGTVELAFAKQPMELRRWAVTDAQGLTTYIILEKTEVGAKIDKKLFLLCDPDAVIKKEGC